MSNGVIDSQQVTNAQQRAMVCVPANNIQSLLDDRHIRVIDAFELCSRVTSASDNAAGIFKFSVYRLNLHIPITSYRGCLRRIL